MPYYGGGSTSGVFYECLYNINILGGRGISTYQANSTENTSDWYSAIASSGNINVASSGGTENFLVFNGGTTYNPKKRYGLFPGTYYVNAPSGHPIAILNKGSRIDVSDAITYTGNPLYKTTKTVTGTDNDGTYDFYHGNIAIKVNQYFPDVSYYCSNHGYMGGSGNFVFEASGDAELSMYGHCQNTHFPHAHVSTIRPASHVLGSGDFTTLQSWEDWADGEPNPYQLAECYSGGNLGTFNLSGWSSTPTPSGYPKIYAKPSEYHGGQFNRGPLISSTTGTNYCSVPYARVDGLVSTRPFSVNTDLAHHVQIKDCAVVGDDGGFKLMGEGSAVSSSGNAIVNCISVGTSNYSPTINQIGFEIGGKDMIGGKVDVNCIGCTSYNNFYGFSINNTKTPGFNGGGNLIVQNCLSTNSNPLDFSYSLGGDGYLKNYTNASQDNTSLRTPKEEGTTDDADFDVAGFRGVTSTSLYENPLNNLNADFRLKSTAPIIGSGQAFTLEGADYSNKDGLSSHGFSEATFDIERNSRLTNESIDIGAYEYISHEPSLAMILYAAGNNDPDSVAFLELYVKGKARNDMSLFTVGPLLNTNAFTLYTKVKAIKFKNNALTLFTKVIGREIEIPLFTKGKTASSSNFDLFTINWLPKGYANLFIKGISSDEAPRESELTLSGASAKGSSTIVASNADISLFIGPSPDRQIRGTADLVMFGTSPFFPKEWKYLRRLNVDSEGYFPSGFGQLLFNPSERSECNETSVHYEFNGNSEDSVGSLNLTPSSSRPHYTSNAGPFGTTCATFANSGSFFSSYNEKFDSGTEGITISFWINKTSEQTSFPGINDWKYPEGIITRAKLSYDENAPTGHGVNISQIIGDWGIFANPKTNTGEKDILFYTHVMDLESDKTIQNEGLTLDLNEWYFIVYTIDTKNKKTYIRTRKRDDFYGFNSQNIIGQNWQTRTLAEAHPMNSSGQPFYVGYNSSNSRSLGSSYGASWRIDDIKISNIVCSKNAMDQEFVKSYENYRDLYFQMSATTLFTLGMDV
tara:strand:+ start:711 stop:3800 length:3090 start_codon:yes stop_codon:yes gene_type:complete